MTATSQMGTNGDPSLTVNVYNTGPDTLWACPDSVDIF
jgi:hypothetical protein